MKNKNVFTVAIISLVAFMGIAAYLWYLYFHDYEIQAILDNCSTQFTSEVELVNTGSVNYTDANPADSSKSIPAYYFSVKNHSDKDLEYIVVLEDVEGTDGCTEETRLTRDELEYELKLDNKTIKSDDLKNLQNNILDSNTIKSKSTNDYSLIIRLKGDIIDYQKKHFHYVVTLKEKE